MLPTMFHSRTITKTAIGFGIPLLLLAVLFGKGLFNEQQLLGIDGNYGWRQLVQTSLENRGTGWWNPYVWLGMGQGTGYNTVFLFPRIFSMRWELLIGYSMMIGSGLLFMYLFLRRLSLDRFSAIFGAIAYGLAPHFITLIYPAHWDAVHSVGLIAPLLYFLQAGLDGRSSGWRAWICLPVAGLFWGLLMNAEVQRGVYISVMAAAYALMLVAQQPRATWPKGAGKIALAGAMLLATFAWNAQIQFGGELVAGSAIATAGEAGDTDAERWAFATSWSFHPKELIDSLAQGFHGMISGDPDKPYWGARPVSHSFDSLSFFAFIFGLAGMVLGARRSPVIRFFSVAALLSFLLACGEYWPGRPLFALWYQLPMMDKMRAPVKFLCVTSFAMAVLSAFGFAKLLQTVRQNQVQTINRWIYLFVGLMILGGIACLYVLGNSASLKAAVAAQVGHPALIDAAYNTALNATLWTMAWSAALTGLLVATKKWPRPALCGSGGIVLLSINLLWLNGFYINRTWFEPDTFFRVDPIVEFLQTNRPPNARTSASLHLYHQGRPIPLPLMADHAVFVTHLSLFHGIPLMENTPQSRIADDYRNWFQALLPTFPNTQTPHALVNQLLEGNLRLWRASAVRYLLTDGHLYGLGNQPLPVFEYLQQHPALTLRYTGKLRGRRHAVFEIADTPPLFQLARETRSVPNTNAMLEILAHAEYDPRVALLIGDAPSSNGEGQVDLRLHQPGWIQLSIETEADALLLWNSRFSPHWQAQINGVESPLLPANHMLSALRIPAGKNNITLRFRPDSPWRTFSLIAVWLGSLVLPLALYASFTPTRIPEHQ